MRKPYAAFLLFGVLAFASVVARGGSEYVADNLFEQYFAPDELLSDHGHLWDDDRGMGSTRGDFWPVPVALTAVLKWLGLTPALAERAWHALLLATAASGAVAVLRLFRSRIGWAHLIAGLAFAFNPFSATYLLPSILFTSYALAPWLVVAFVRGVRPPRHPRWLGIFALLIFAGQAFNLPALAYACLPILPVALYLVTVERSVSRHHVLRWTLLASLLVAIVSAAAIVRLVADSDSLAANLAASEQPGSLSAQSSWAESLRGLGYWLSYYRDPSGLVRPELEPYLRNPWVVLASFALPVTAVWAVAWARWRPALAMAGVALLAGTLMVSTYPNPVASPLGRALTWAFDEVPYASGFRNTYKAGPGLLLSFAVLFGVACDQWLRQRRWLTGVPLIAALAGLGVGAFPYVTGGLYPEQPRMSEVPGYWTSALQFLEDESDQGRVLVLPSSTNTHYRWGSPGNDIFDALLGRPHVVKTKLPQSSPEAEDVLAALDEVLARSLYEQGTLGPVARRLGISRILIRNDLDWQRMGSPRPARLEGVRTDPDLRSLRRFGNSGENVVGSGDSGPEALAERELPPVEIFELRQPIGSLLQGAPSVVHEGGGAGWLALAEEGLLSGVAPLRPAAAMSASALTQQLREGSLYAVTDSNRRRVQAFSRFGLNHSGILTRGQDLDRPAGDLFDVPGSQSVSWHRDAIRIHASGFGTLLNGYQPWLRPAHAFDGLPLTAWQAGGLESGVGEWVEVQLLGRKVIPQVTLVASPPPGIGRTVSRATVVLSDGTEVSADLRTGKVTVDLPSRPTASLEVRIDAVSGTGDNPVGFSEIEVADADLREFVELPHSSLLAADRHQQLAGAISTASIRYLVTRARGGGPQDEEPILRRRMRTLAARSYELTGMVQLAEGTPDRTIDQIIGGDVGAFGTSRFQGRVEHRGRLAVDGRADTGWTADPRRGETLTVRFPTQVIERVLLSASTQDAHSRVTSANVRIGSQELTVSVDGSGVAEFPPTTASELNVEILGVQPRPDGHGGFHPVRIDEVDFGVASSPAEPLTRRSSACIGGLLTIDGRDVPLRFDAPLGEVLFPLPVPVSACQSTTINGGIHLIEGTGAAHVNRITFAAGPDFTSRSASRGAVQILERKPDRMVMQISADDDGQMVTTGQSFDRRWRARLDGHDLGAPQPLNAMNAWPVPVGTHRVVVFFTGEVRYQRALMVTASGLALCVGLVLWPRARGGRRRRA